MPANFVKIKFWFKFCKFDSKKKISAAPNKIDMNKEKIPLNKLFFPIHLNFVIDFHNPKHCHPNFDIEKNGNKSAVKLSGSKKPKFLCNHKQI